MFRILFGVPIVLLFVVGSLGLFFSVTWYGRSIGLSAALLAVTLFCTVGYWDRSWFRRIRLPFYSVLISLCIGCLVIPVARSPNGGSKDARIRNAYLGGQNAYSRFAPWNIVPEEDQVSVVIALSSLFDKHVNSNQAAQIRALAMPIYKKINSEDDFRSLGSAMGMAYHELLQIGFRDGHYFVFLPESKSDDRLPCLVFLHGMGGNRKSNFWAMTQIAKQMECVVIAPSFGLGNWENESGAETVVSVVNEALDALPVDRNKVFLAGYSNGAKGVTRAVVKAPSLFRGLIYLSPVTEDELFTSPGFIQNHQFRRVLFLHGDHDSRIPVQSVEDTVELLRRMGGQVRLKMYQGEGHYLILSQLESITAEIAEFIREE